EPAHGHERRTEVEQLRPDVRVQPEALRKSPDRVDRIVWRKPELRPVVRRLDGLERVRLDPGRYPDEATCRTERARPLELVERVETDHRPLLDRAPQQLVLLVVPVDDELRALHART